LLPKALFLQACKRVLCRAFTFANAVKLWGTQNPHFFDGTVVANEAAAVLAEPTLRAAAE